MARIPVKSSNVKSVGQNIDEHTIDVEFQNGTVYRYYNVDPTVASTFMKVVKSGEGSVGSYFYQHLRGLPKQERLEKDPEKPIEKPPETVKSTGVVQAHRVVRASRG